MPERVQLKQLVKNQNQDIERTYAKCPDEAQDQNDICQDHEPNGGKLNCTNLGNCNALGACVRLDRRDVWRYPPVAPQSWTTNG